MDGVELWGGFQVRDADGLFADGNPGDDALPRLDVEFVRRQLKATHLSLQLKAPAGEIEQVNRAAPPVGWGVRRDMPESLGGERQNLLQGLQTGDGRPRAQLRRQSD